MHKKVLLKSVNVLISKSITRLKAVSNTLQDIDFVGL